MTFGDECFLQLIEGPPAANNALYAELQRDPRHKDLQLLGYRNIDRRSFSNWAMGFLEFDQFRGPGGRPFDPYELSTDEALAKLHAAGRLAGIAA